MCVTCHVHPLDPVSDREKSFSRCIESEILLLPSLAHLELLRSPQTAMFLLYLFEFSHKFFVNCLRVYPFVCLSYGAGFSVAQVFTACRHFLRPRQYLKKEEHRASSAALDVSVLAERRT